MRTNNTNQNKIIYPELSYLITGLCFDIHNSIGRFCREKQYSDAIENKLKALKIPFQREFILKDTGNILDFIVDNKIILEIKAENSFLKENYYQIQRYLQASNLKLGLLINFRNRYLKPIRIIRIDTNIKNKYL